MHKKRKGKRKIKFRFWSIFKIKYILSNEDRFLQELTDNYIRWKEEGEDEFAEAYKILLNKFTTDGN